MLRYRILFGVVAVTAAAIVFFFLWGLGDGSVSVDNMALWLAMLAVPGTVLFAGYRLAAAGRHRAAAAALAVVAVPAALVGLFFLIVILAGPDWR